jgi:hypothetical protein
MHTHVTTFPCISHLQILAVGLENQRDREQQNKTFCLMLNSYIPTRQKYTAVLSDLRKAHNHISQTEKDPRGHLEYPPVS